MKIWMSGRELNIDCFSRDTWRNVFFLHTYTLLLLIFYTVEVTADSLLIRGGTLIDMTGADRIENANILIRHEIIERIWSGSASESLPPDTRIIDVTGKYIIPGLIDSHIHYNWYMGELFLAHGITTVNDLGSRIHWQSAVRNGLNSGRLRGPRYLFCGRIGGESSSNYAAAAQRNLFTSASHPDQVEQAVAAIKANADCIRQSMDTPEVVFTSITSTANAAGLSVIAHSYDALHSAAMGVNGIEHLEGVAIATIRSSDGLQALQFMQLEEGHKNPLLYQWMEPAHYDTVISALINKNVYLNPTLIHEWKGVIDRTGEFEQDDLRLFNHPSLQYFPMDEKLVVLGEYHWADQAMLADEENLDADQQLYVNNSYYLPVQGLRQQLADGYLKVQEFLQRFVAAGGKLYSGTDTAASNTPGLSLHHEMQLLVDAGIPEFDALLASTRWAAEILRIDDRLGTVQAGKIADILVLTADPEQDIVNTRKIEKVIKAGKVVDTTYNNDYHFPFHQYGPVSKHLYHRQPLLDHIQPGITVQGSYTTLRITGRNFMPESVVLFNDETVATEYLSTTEMSAVLGPRQTANPGSFLINVYTPAPGGGLAEAVEFIIDFTD